MLALISFFAVLLGWIVQGFLGIGSGIIATAILLLFADAKTVVVSLAPIALIGTGYLALINFKRFVLMREVAILTLTSLFGVLLGSILLKSLPSNIILVIFGFVVVLTGLYDYYSQNKRILINSKHRGILASVIGFVGGIISALVGGAGPLYAFFFNQISLDKHDFKFVISFFFFLLNVGRVVVYLMSPLKGYFNMQIIIPSVIAVFLGAYIGHWLFKKVNTKAFKEVVSISIVIFGFYFIVKGLATL